MYSLCQDLSHGTIIFDLVTLTLKFDLLLKNFNLGCYKNLSDGCRPASVVVFWQLLFKECFSADKKYQPKSDNQISGFVKGRGSGFDSQSCRYNFRDWLSPASKSQYIWNTAVRSSEVNPQYNNNEKHGSLWHIHTCMYKFGSLCTGQYL